MTKDKIFTDIQNIVSNNPVVIIGSGASVSYGIPGMGTLAAELKSFFSSKTFPNVDSQKSVQDFLENLKKGLGLEEALLETKATQAGFRCLTFSAVNFYRSNESEILQ